MIIDKNKIEVKHGDLLKIYHFTMSKGRRKVYVYRLACKLNENFEIDEKSETIYAIPVFDLLKKQSIKNTEKYNLSWHNKENVEIIGSECDLFFERKKHEIES